MGIFEGSQEEKKVSHNKEAWKNIMLEGMREDFTWDKSAGLYKDMYEDLMQ